MANLKTLRPPWQPGQSGNPNGVGRIVQTLAAEDPAGTGRGDVIQFFTAVIAAVVEWTGRPADGRWSPSPWQRRAHECAGWGRPRVVGSRSASYHGNGGAADGALRRLSDDERATLRGLLAKVLATPESGPSVPSAVGERQAPLEPLDDANAPRETGAPATLGRPRNVGRAIAQALELPGSGARVSRRGPRARARFPATPPGLTVRESVVHPRRRTRPARHLPARRRRPARAGARRSCQEHGVDVSSDPSEPPMGSPHRLQGEPRPRTAHLAPEAGSG